MHHNLAQMHRRRFLCAGAAATFLARPVIAQSVDVETIDGLAFGTTWRITGPASANVTALRRPTERLFQEIDIRMSPWRSDSEVGRFNQTQIQALEVSPDTRAVAKMSLEIAEQSDGFFDPTVGPAVSRWGFGPIAEGSDIGWRAISVSETALAKSANGVTFDPCGIAKGWALDRLADLARENGHTDLLLDLGGELLAIGRHPTGREWQVAIADPRPRSSRAHTVLALGARAIATTGVETQSYQMNDHRYSHIIDPTTGEPAQGALLSVTVMSNSAMLADAWATALFAAGDVRGPSMAQSLDIAAVFLFERGGSLKRVTTGDARLAVL